MTSTYLWTAALACFSTVCFGQNDFQITGVEEDWEVVIGQPSPSQDSPQISTWMSPTDNLEGEHFAADFNHAQRPDFSSGGFQIKANNAETLIADRISDGGDNLVYDNETVRWTQRMELAGAALEFSISNGHSESWGNFGGNGFKVRIPNSPVTNLNQYSVNQSVEWAGVGFGGNRVESFRLKRVRYYVNGQFFAAVDVDLPVFVQ